MNTRARVKALPVMVAASLGLGSISSLGKALAHPGHVHVSPNLQPTGLEELNLTVEEAGVTGMPESIAAGRYLVKVTGPEPGEMGPSGIMAVQLPEGLSAEQAYEDVMANPDAMPEWVMTSHFAGGVVLDQGPENWAVMDFTPGAWIVTTLFGSTLGVEFEVTGELPAELPDPGANVTLDLLEMVIRVSDGEFVAGENLVTVHNAGAQLHFVDISKVPDGTTKEQIEGLMDSFMTGTPPAADGLQEADVVPAAYIAELSGGVSVTVPLTLEAGTYFLSCWIPDTESFAPHAMMGMWDVIVID